MTMASGAGSCYVLPLPSIPRSSPSVRPNGCNSSTRALCSHRRELQQRARDDEKGVFCAAFPSLRWSLRSRESRSCCRVLSGGIGPAKGRYSRHYGAPLSPEDVVVVGNHEQFQLGQQQQQLRQLWRDDDTSRRRRAPSRSTKWVRNYCKSSLEETYADVVPRSSTAASCKPVLDSKLSSQNRLNAQQFEKLKFWIITVNTSDELLAAATLRAQLFYSYPKFNSPVTEGLEVIKARLRHEFDMRDLMKSRVKSEFQRDTKMQLLNMNVKCLLAVCEESHFNELLLSFADERNSLIALPAVALPAFSSKPLVAIGTLDIQISEPGLGHSLLSISSSGPLLVKHGYIFNLCVSEIVRRQGVATALMREAVQAGQQMKLQILYVHVEVNNDPALALYQKLGYIVEEEEPLDVAMRFQRARRILLSCRFQ